MKLFASLFGLGIGALAIFMTVIAALVSAFALWTQSNLIFYLSYFQDKTVEVEYWAAWLVSLVALGVAGLVLWGNAILSVFRIFL